MNQTILILDFGSQYTQLIARRLREMGYYSEIHAFSYDHSKIKENPPAGIILSGGPSSVTDVGAPTVDVKALAQIAPLLGICYGMQLMAREFGGQVEKSVSREYGYKNLTWVDRNDPVARHVPRVWMSHGDVVTQIPKGFSVWAKSDSEAVAAMRAPRLWAVQFHPEVSHTQGGLEFLRLFVELECHLQASWKAPHIIEVIQKKLRSQVNQKDKILVALSGGVDSTVAAQLLTQTFGADRVLCLFIDNGLLRKGESEQVVQSYLDVGLNYRRVDAADRFLAALKDVADPEQKRKTIGRVFIEVFESELNQLPSEVKYLAQGTLYPDVIESVSPNGTAVTIKSHHNVGGLPAKMKLELIEPLRDLFKDEVRRIGKELGLKSQLLERHPFPGPGLAIRVMGAINPADLEILRECDFVFIESLRELGLYTQIWQAFCVLLPIHTVGVQGDERTYDKVVALRAVTSVDGMTADWFEFSGADLKLISNRITNQVKGINRVVYDITSKPPGTIEWE